MSDRRPENRELRRDLLDATAVRQALQRAGGEGFTSRDEILIRRAAHAWADKLDGKCVCGVDPSRWQHADDCPIWDMDMEGI